MCGIVGLYLKTSKLEPRLGELTSRMLATMTDRGPDSAGFAVYSLKTHGVKMTLRGENATVLTQAVTGLEGVMERTLDIVTRDTHVVIVVPADMVDAVRSWIGGHAAGVDVVSVGQRMEIYKETGLPELVAERFDLAGMCGTHAIGHTRMATESAVTTSGAHPFSTGADQCLVHNGSLSNHNGLRRMLESKGIEFVTQNDTEVAAGYLTWRMAGGASLKEALESSLRDLDGFYTFVVGTRTGFAVLRDPIACKPAVMAETADYVAFGSEYRALVGLPDIGEARVFEPEPATVYAWDRA